MQPHEGKSCRQPSDDREVQAGYAKVAALLNALQEFYKFKDNPLLSADVKELSQHNRRDDAQAFPLAERSKTSAASRPRRGSSVKYQAKAWASATYVGAPVPFS
jgi:hypothetical protein